MKIAFTSLDKNGLRGRVAQHFGRAPYFVFVEVEEGKIKQVETKQNPFLTEHTHGAVPNLMINEGVKVVVTGGIGANASSILRNAGIRVITAQGGKIEDILKDFLEEGLNES